MVKTTTSRTKASSSNPVDNTKFSHNVLVKTEKIIKFAKLLQDFIILQQNEILPYCVNSSNNEENTNKEDNKEEITQPLKRRVGRPPKNQVREILSEDNEMVNGRVPLTKEGQHLLKSDIMPKRRNKPVMIRCGVDDNGLPLYKRVFNPSSPKSESGKSKCSIPSDVIKKLDDYILNEFKEDDESFVSASSCEKNNNSNVNAKPTFTFGV